MTNNTQPERPHLSARSTFLLSQLGYLSADQFTARLRTLGLQPRHFALLSQLAQLDGQSQQQLAAAMAIHRNIMVGIVDDLEGRGLVQRRRHPHDRRAHALHLMPGARELLTEAEQLADQHEADLTGSLSESERRQLISLLQRLAIDTGLIPDVHPGLHNAREI